MTETEFYTHTMAQVYTQQGHYDKAAEIYRYLLDREPERRDIQEALADIEEKIGEGRGGSDRNLIPLFRQWIDLAMRYNRLLRLKKWQHTVSVKE